MTREEFLKKLEQELDGSVDNTVIRQNISFYNDYISDEIVSGKSEYEVMATLGEPALIAKTIIDANKNSEYRNEVYNNTVDENGNIDPGREIQPKFKFTKISPWVFVIILAVILIALIAIVGKTVSFIFRLPLPVLIIGIILIVLFKKKD